MQLAWQNQKARVPLTTLITRLDGLVVAVIAAPRRQSPQKRYDEALRRSATTTRCLGKS